MTAPRAALYARVSTDEQSPDLQVEELRRLAEQRGWRVVDEYVDRGVSGVKESRPALDALLADAHPQRAAHAAHAGRVRPVRA